jgi:hypothetical protein
MNFRALRIYSMARARDCIGTARSLWVRFARRDNHRMIAAQRRCEK